MTGGIARITLNRPDRSNALDRALADALIEATAVCAADETVRVLVLDARGRNFSAGGDVAPLAGDRDVADRLTVDMTDRLHQVVATIAGLSIPVIAVAQGYAVGGGLGLLCAADLVIAAESAKFMTGFGRIGLATDCGVGYTLPRLVGARTALDLILTNRVVDAAEALRIGIASRVVPDADLASATDELARTLADGPRQAFAAAKCLIRDGATLSFPEHLAREQAAQRALCQTDDARNRIRSLFDGPTASPSAARRTSSG
ncbi:enoyl-CoA hydratase/isomerase family protein [Tsukamurella sp. PLM1]|uniref:enoyl-CoA hydratase/isomerase family protein n=1 Tax=Tsukamurella sp. PLM1 TaxID=2929795 RepID=UPI0020C09CD3|nr:enoyl-CoA hydratase-related protein [Tsukamurella sp. PLM1]